MKKSPGDAVPLELGAIYRAHALRVASWAARLGGPGLDVEDSVHEVFLTVHKLLPQFRGDAKLTTWLYRITENVVRDRRRKARRSWLRNLLAGREPARPSAPTPIEELERREASERVYRIVDSMNERYRTVLVLFEIEQLSGEEIAELTSEKLENVWVLLHRARAQFRERLSKLPDSDRKVKP